MRRKERNAKCSLLLPYYHIHQVYVQIDGNDLIAGGGTQFHDLEWGICFLFDSDGYRHVQKSRFVNIGMSNLMIFVTSTHVRKDTVFKQ